MHNLTWDDVPSIFETSDSLGQLPAVELFNKDTIGKGLKKLRHEEKASAELVKNVLELSAPKWLPLAAETYELSSDQSDYILVPTIIVPSDIPNRNKTAFPYIELSRFNPQSGSLSYRSWIGKPCHVDHQNRDISKAVGVVMDTAMVPMASNGGKLWKVMSLMAFDRSKSPEIAEQILSGRRNSYSMGANVLQYSCSVCGSVSKPGSRVLACGVEHVTGPRSPYKIFERRGRKVLGHRNSHGITGFEISTVTVPAWPSAVTGTDKLMKL